MQMNNSLGSWAFILGVIIAILGGAFGGYAGAYGPWITFVLVIIGLVVGFLNIGAKEVNDFLLSSIALVAVGVLSGSMLAIDAAIPLLGTVLQSIVQNIAAFVAPAALVVALKAIYSMGKTPAA